MSPRTPKCHENKRVMDLLRSYGKEFLVFDPDDQPNVFAEDEERFPPARSGKVNPKQMKNWRHIPRVLQLLRDRYGLFRSGRLITDCPLFIEKPRKDDDAKEFRKAVQVIVSRGLVWFRCRRAHFCGRKGCPVQKKALLDIYDLICWLDGNKDLNHARKVIAEYFDVELANFPQSTGSSGKMNEAGTKKADWLRYAVPKEALERLFRLPSSGRGAPQRFLRQRRSKQSQVPQRSLTTVTTPTRVMPSCSAEVSHGKSSSRGSALLPGYLFGCIGSTLKHNGNLC